MEGKLLQEASSLLILALLCEQGVRSLLSDSQALAAAFHKDRMLAGFGGRQLKILLDIILENQRVEGFTACELGAGAGGFTKQVE